MVGSTNMTHGRMDKLAKDSCVHYKKKLHGISFATVHIFKDNMSENFFCVITLTVVSGEKLKVLK